MGNMSLINQFIQTYNSAQVAIDANEKKAAKLKYNELLESYNEIKSSKLNKKHKDLAYSQIQKVYSGVQGIRTRKSIGRFAIAIAVFVILLSGAVVIKPTFFGLVVLDKAIYGNEPPKWISDQKTFDLSGSLDINLNDYFIDPDGDELTFLTSHQKGLKIALMNNKIKVMNDGASGQVPLDLIASDGRTIVREKVTINVVG
jgi:hypothetical protein